MYYETPQMLYKQLEMWQSYPEFVKEQVEFVVVDDGSLSNPAVIDNVALNLTFARVLENVPWNHPGSQNLCAHLAKGKWLVSCGIDHVLSIKDIDSLLKLDRTEEVNYRISRRSTQE